MKEDYNAKLDEFDKKLDMKFIKRLMKYAKKYYFLLVICVLMIGLSTVVDLGRPYLMKIAIDDNINGHLKKMIVTEKNITGDGVLYDGMYYTRIDEFEDGEIPNEHKESQLISYEKEKYLLQGTLQENDKIIEGKDTEQGARFNTEDGESIEGIKLEKSDYTKFRERDSSGLKQITIILLIFLVSGFAFNYIQGYILNFVGQKVILNIRSDLFKHVQNLSLSFYDKTPVGKVVTRLTNDMFNINQLFTSVIVSFLKDIALIVGVVIAMVSMDAKLALMSLMTMPLIFIVAYIFRVKARAAQRVVKKRLSVINTSLNENINGMNIIQSFQLQKKFYGEFDEINKNHKKASMKELSVYAVFRPIVNIIYYLTWASIIYFAGKGVMNGQIQYGVLFAFTKYLETLFNPIFDLTEKFNILQSSMTSCERVFALLDTEVDIKNKEGCKEISEIKGDIEFKNVWFKYDKDWVLRDISFKINKGDSVAFVGATGSGKSTIINLIGRMYEIQQGQILIDGIDIKELDKDSLRRRISTVLQDVFMFSGDIKENIRLYDENVSLEDIEEASKYVNADVFIDKLPNKYDEKVVERGATLSTGQRQLISFARALAFKPDVLVLDEATSNIDTETETLIQDAINKIIEDKTSIVVAHRLSTIKHCNKIIVLHKGKIREMGQHDELLEMKGIYHKLYSLQYE